MSENLAGENQVKTASEVSSQKDDSNKEENINTSQDAPKEKSKEEGGNESNVPGESGIGNQEPTEILDKVQQDKPEEQAESTLILNLDEKQKIKGAEDEDADDDNPGDDEGDDKSEQDKK